MNVEAFILAGGRSSRLGRHKVTEQIGGRTLAERALETVQLSGTASRTTFVVGSDLASAAEAARLDAPFVFDLVEGRGPLGALWTALANATSDWIFVFACDLPLVPSELLIRLNSFIPTVPDDCGAVVPEQPDGRLQPLCAFYNVRVSRPVVERIVERPRVPPPMHEVLGKLNPRVVSAAEYADTGERVAPLFINVNTENDLRAAWAVMRDERGDQAAGTGD